MRKIVLASASPIRATLLANAGLEFDIDPAHVDETALRERLAGADPADVARSLAEAKAGDVARRHPEALVIGADQILVFAGEILGKPESRDSARDQLRLLRGNVHSLYSAFACARHGTIFARHCGRADLTMRSFSDAFLDAYLDRMGDNLLRSVGAYQLEGLGAQLFERVDGDYFTILGLPLLELLAALRAAEAIAP